MVFKKCEFLNCEAVGDCRCPKDRTLKEYYYFCKKHAAEYNKNWNYYAGMTTEEILKDDEKARENVSAFGTKSMHYETDIEFLKKFLHSKTGKEVHLSKPTYHQLNALKVFGLTWPTSFENIKKEYRKLAKKYHPDIGGNEKLFAEINSAFSTLKKWLDK